MNTRRLILTGIVLSLAGGCAGDPRTAGESGRRHFEVTPTGTYEPNPDAYAGHRPQMSDPPVDLVQNRVRSTAQALSSATPARSIPPAAAVATPAPIVPPYDWLNPDNLRLTNAPQAHAPAAPSVADRSVTSSPEDQQPADAGASVANQGTQIVRPPVAPPAPPAPVAASAKIPSSEGPTYPSLHGGVTATADIDPDPLGHKFAQKMRDFPTDLSAHLDYQMLRFLRDEQVPELDVISTLPSEDRELLTAVMDGMSNFRSGLRADRNMLLSQKVKPIIDMADRVRVQAELSIPTIAICSRVQGFGVYEPMPTTLRAGVDNTVIIYCEVENFSSEQNEKGMWETKLNQEAVLYTETGYTAWRDKSDIPVDLSRNRRHDFFVVKKVTLPRTLGVGRYVLKVSVVDEQVRRVAENSVQIQLMAQ